MKTVSSLLAFIAATLFTGCAGTSSRHDFTGILSTAFTVTVTCGASDLGFTGTIVSDGHPEHVSGVGSGEFQVAGHEITFAFRKAEPMGRISLSISKTAGDFVGEAITDEVGGGVRAELLYAPEQQHALFTSF